MENINTVVVKEGTTLSSLISVLESINIGNLVVSRDICFTFTHCTSSEINRKYVEKENGVEKI